MAAAGVNADVELAIFEADHGSPDERRAPGSGRVGRRAERAVGGRGRMGAHARRGARKRGSRGPGVRCAWARAIRCSSRTPG